MLKIPVIKGDINRALKLFKRKFRNTKVLQELRERKNYIKPSLNKRKQKQKSILTRKYKENNDE